MPPRMFGRRGEQMGADGVLVETAGIAGSLFEIPERGRQKAGLPNQPLGSPVHVGTAVESSEGEALKIVNRLLMPLQRIEEIEHGGDKTRSDTKRRVDTCVCGCPTCHREHRLAL